MKYVQHIKMCVLKANKSAEIQKGITQHEWE